MSQAPPVVATDSITVELGGRAVLHDVSVSVDAGEFVALMGPNGSGKSTLVRAMTGLLPAASGTVRLFGTEVDRFRDRSRLGYVPQRAGASSGVPASVAEVVTSGRISRRGLLRPARQADRRAVQEALEVVGLADRARDTVTALSGGQQQRVLIARALAAQPDVFFLDEPMAGVDLPNQQALADALGLLSQRGATIVLVVHEIGAVGDLIDRCIVMRDGRVAYDGLPLTELQVHAAHLPGIPLAVEDHLPHGAGHPDRHAQQHAHHPGDEHAHERAPHDCPPGHSDVAPGVVGPLDGGDGDRGGRR